MNLNGFDVEEAKILRLSGKPQNAPEGMMQGQGGACRVCLKDLGAEICVGNCNTHGPISGHGRDQLAASEFFAH